MNKRIKTNTFNSVSIIMPMRNSSTTVTESLKSLELQRYPIKEVIVIDNASEDNSLKVVSQYKRRTKLAIKIIARAKNGGIGSSYNLGVKNTRSSVVVLMHSDCTLPTENELEKLTEPMRKDPTVLATFPTIDLPMHIWNKYSFWEKCFFARLAGKGHAGPTAKFDCIRKDIYLTVGGFDTVNFGVGGEDMDLAKKIEAQGKFALSKAHATHLHYLGSGYNFQSFLRKQKQYAMIYGRLLKRRPQLFFGKGIILLLKPFLAILPFLPFVGNIGIGIIIVYSFLFTKKMFTTRSTLGNWRILILPFVNIFLIYYETFWLIYSFLFGENTVS